MVFSTIFSKGKNETPLLVSVPSVRANRLKAAARKTDPMIGSRNFTPSHISAPRGERRYQRSAPTTPVFSQQEEEPVVVKKTADFEQNERGQRQDFDHLG